MHLTGYIPFLSAPVALYNAFLIPFRVLYLCFFQRHTVFLCVRHVVLVVYISIERFYRRFLAHSESYDRIALSKLALAARHTEALENALKLALLRLYVAGICIPNYPR